MKSGTSIGANTREVQNAERKADFIHKFKIVAKEADEIAYWLQLCKFSKNHPNCDYLIVKLESIEKILSKNIGTLKRKTR